MRQPGHDYFVLLDLSGARIDVLQAEDLDAGLNHVLIEPIVLCKSRCRWHDHADGNNRAYQRTFMHCHASFAFVVPPASGTIRTGRFVFWR
jgi:hypothetical protein